MTSLCIVIKFDERSMFKIFIEVVTTINQNLTNELYEEKTQCSNINIIVT